MPSTPRFARPLVATTAALALIAGATAAFAAPGVPASPPPYVSTVHVADAPLVADAGDSAFVQAGERAVLLGTQFGGTPPYTYAWTAEAGRLEAPTNPTGVIDTTGLDGGTYTATLTVTDADGVTASSDVLFTVADAGEEVALLDETISPDPPGVLDLPTGSTEFPFEVPAGLASIEAVLTWTDPTNDYDLRLVDPDGNEAAFGGDFIPDDSETAAAANPAPGTWIAEVQRFATHGDLEVNVTATGRTASIGDPRPTADAGGPYRFVIGDEQHLSGTATGDGVSTAWDIDLDGVFETAGDDVIADLPPGRHLVSFRATSADGHTARQMTSVLVGTEAELDRLATPVTVVGVADSGINPYHLEFSAATYPDPEVLELTRNFTRHPSEYIPGYPADAAALPITLGEGYFPDQDTYLWERTAEHSYVTPGQVHWIPGTKIVGAIDAGGFGGSVHPILDDNGHGTGSASVSTGNRYGYCPTCLLVMADSLGGGTAAINRLDWVDISTNSWGYTGGVPIGYVEGADEDIRDAVERGQTVLFAAGNGVGNTFFDVPQFTYGSDLTGPDWTITVGAIREDSQGAIISDGVPAHVSNLGDGDLPSACRTGDTGQCAFSGTSAATPYTAGVFGTVLTEIRRALGDHAHPGQRAGQVIAAGTPIAGSPFLEDGQLTRQELRAVVLKTAAPRYDAEQEGRFYPLPQQWNLDQAHYVFEGYGSPGPAAAERAIEVLLGQWPLPDRAEEDEFFLRDCEARDAQYGSYDRTGDGDADGCDAGEAVAFTGDGELTNDDPRVGHYDAARDGVAQDEVASDPFTYWLHRRPVHAPTEVGTPPGDDPLESGGPCAETHNESYLDRADTEGDVDTCFDDRITSTVAAYRPKGIFAAKDALTAPLAAGSQVDVTAHVKSQEPSVTELVAVLKATDREIGRSEPVVAPTNPLTWAEFQLSFETVRPVAAGEQLSFHFVHLGARGYAYGYEGEVASSLTITPAGQPEGGLEFGVTIGSPAADDVLEDGEVTVAGQVAFPALGADPQLAGFHPTSEAVQVSVDDPDFLRPSYASIDPDAGTYTLTVAGLEDGTHTLYVRALRDRYASSIETVTVTVGSDDDEADDPKDRGRRPPVVPPKGPPDQPGPPPWVPGKPTDQGATVGLDAQQTGAPAEPDRSMPIAVALVTLLLAASAVRRAYRSDGLSEG